MCEVLYTRYEGGLWKRLKVKYWSEEHLKKLCESQCIEEVDPYNKIRLPVMDDIEAAAVMFHDGLIWDAILSAYDTMRVRGLPRCFPLAFQNCSWRWEKEDATR